MTEKREIFPVLRLALEQKEGSPKNIPLEWAEPLAPMMTACTGYRFESLRSQGMLTPQAIMHYAHGTPWNDRLPPIFTRYDAKAAVAWLKAWDGMTPASYALDAHLFLEADPKAIFEKYNAETFPREMPKVFIPSASSDRRAGRPLQEHRPEPWSGEPKEPDFTPLPPKAKKQYQPKIPHGTNERIKEPAIDIPY